MANIKSLMTHLLLNEYKTYEYLKYFIDFITKKYKKMPDMKQVLLKIS